MLLLVNFTKQECPKKSAYLIIEWRGKPDAIRCDNGPEYISAVTLGWAAKRGIRIDFIQPGQRKRAAQPPVMSPR